MSEERKRGVWPCVAALLIGLPPVYVLSVGPWNWFVARGWISQQTVNAVEWLYRPIDWICYYGPEPVGRAVNWYIRLWR